MGVRLKANTSREICKTQEGVKEALIIAKHTSNVKALQLYSLFQHRCTRLGSSQ
jgi:hypothetical protein